MTAGSLDTKYRLAAILLSIAVAIVLGGCVVVSTGANPLSVYLEIVRGAFAGRGLEETLARSVPLVGMALSIAIALRAGLVNLGGDGQMLVGGLVAVLVALYLPVPGPARAALALIAAMCAGGLYAWIAAILQLGLAIPFLIASLLMSYIARGVTSYLVRYPLRDPSTGMPETHRVLSSARLPNAILDLPISMGMLIMAVVAIGVVVNDRSGVNGFEWRMTGLNPRFAQYSGTNLPRQTQRVAFLSGAVAGLVGALIILGQQYRFTDGALLAPGYTWSGLMAAVLAMASPIATVVVSVFFAALQVGGFAMERALGLPAVLTWVLQALIILCLAARPVLFRRR
ncbi:ABC transporter permease [Shinella sp.]|uniref:ABC transporter permease n=1 Tax=Shinella sp. TaxID=1870904 RepID=UPI0029B09E7B|nr:ABC transporter permease [Shinella sp.]MDX3978456.1 ABC transporter permease [Shinella sp.]